LKKVKLNKTQLLFPSQFNASSSRVHISDRQQGTMFVIVP